MKATSRSLFRTDAMRRYSQQQAAAIPRLVSPHTFTYLWLLLGLLGIGSVVAWMTKIPVYAAGRAIVVKGTSLKLVAFLPVADRSHLRVGQSLIVQSTDNSDRLIRSIVAVVPQIVSPDTIQKQFNLAPGTIAQPATIAIADFAPDSPDLLASAYIGSTYRVSVEIGSQRAICLLPQVEQFCRE